MPAPIDAATPVGSNVNPEPFADEGLMYSASRPCGWFARSIATGLVYVRDATPPDGLHWQDIREIGTLNTHVARVLHARDLTVGPSQNGTDGHSNGSIRLPVLAEIVDGDELSIPDGGKVPRLVTVVCKRTSGYVPPAFSVVMDLQAATTGDDVLAELLAVIASHTSLVVSASGVFDGRAGVNLHWPEPGTRGNVPIDKLFVSEDCQVVGFADGADTLAIISPNVRAIGDTFGQGGGLRVTRPEDHEAPGNIWNAGQVEGAYGADMQIQAVDRAPLENASGQHIVIRAGSTTAPPEAGQKGGDILLQPGTSNGGEGPMTSGRIVLAGVPLGLEDLERLASVLGIVAAGGDPLCARRLVALDHYTGDSIQWTHRHDRAYRVVVIANGGGVAGDVALLPNGAAAGTYGYFSRTVSPLTINPEALLRVGGVHAALGANFTVDISRRLHGSTCVVSASGAWAANVSGAYPFSMVGVSDVDSSHLKLLFMDIGGNPLSRVFSIEIWEVAGP